MYKRFEAETLRAAHHKAKLELGPDVVILSSREVRKGGLTGILGKKVWQVVAFCPEDGGAPPKSATGSSTQVPSTWKQMPARAEPPSSALDRSKSKVRQSVNHLVDEPALPFSELPPTAKPQAPADRGPSEIMSSFKPKLLKSSPPAAQPARPADPHSGMDSAALRIVLKEVRALSDKLRAPAQPVTDQVILPGVLPAFYQRLLIQEVPRETAVDAMNAMCDCPTLDMNDETQTLEKLEDHLASIIPVTSIDELFAAQRGPRVFFLVGPAGVGKSSTLAKVAALATRDEHQKVAFITIDTFRIAAAEQLKSYADLMHADIEIVFSEDEFTAAVVRHADKDMILVDTPGKNPCSPATLSDFSGYVKRLSAAKLPPPVVLLALSAATRLADLQRYISCYRALDPKGIVFTKIDETNTFGSLLPALTTGNLPLVFMTSGQDVPEDIEPANSRRLARRILGQ